MGSAYCRTRNSSHLRRTPATRHRHNVACPQSTATCPRALPAAPTGGAKRPVAAALARAPAPTSPHAPPCQPTSARPAAPQPAAGHHTVHILPLTPAARARPGMLAALRFVPGKQAAGTSIAATAASAAATAAAAAAAALAPPLPQSRAAGRSLAASETRIHACRAATDRGSQQRPAPC